MNTNLWTFDSFQSLLRAVLKIGGGYLLAKGLADESAVEALTAGAVALAAIIWGVAHRSPPASSKMPPTTPLVLLLAVALLIGCASANTRVFRAERLTTDMAYAALMAWKGYFVAAVTNAAPAERGALSNRNECVYEASRRFAATMVMVDAMREACATNAAVSNRVALEMMVGSAQANSSNLAWLVRGFSQARAAP